MLVVMCFVLFCSVVVGNTWYSLGSDIVFSPFQNRAKATGRVVPQDLLETTLEIVPTSVARLAPLVDFCAEIENPGTGDISLVSPQGWTWKSFRHQWDQRCSS